NVDGRAKTRSTEGLTRSEGDLVQHTEHTDCSKNVVGIQSVLHVFAEPLSIVPVFFLLIVRLQLRQSRVQDAQCIQIGHPPEVLVDG
ncbi:unnamed protein product, partial [Mycena citricolor]